MVINYKMNFDSEAEPEVLTKPPFPPLMRDVFDDEGSFFWRGEVYLASWIGFATEQDLDPDGWSLYDPPRDGELSLTVDPLDMSAGSEPTEAQARAFQHLLDNEQAIRDAVLQGIFEVYPQWRESYFPSQISTDGGRTFQPASAFPEMFPADNMPEISSPDGLMRLIRPSEVFIRNDAKEGFAEVGFSFGCKWDEEHGLGVLTHKGKVIQVGDASASFQAPD